MMKIWKKVLLLLCLTALPNYTNAFNDVSPDDPQLQTFLKMQEMGIMSMDTLGNFTPSRVPTRAEALVIAMRAAGMPVDYEAWDGNAYYSDVNPNEWYAPAIKTAVDRRIVWNNVENFRPTDAITKAEFLAFLFRATRVNFDQYFSQTKNVADDVPEDAWFAPHFAYAKRYQIAHLPPDQLYRPLKWLTRREIAMITERQIRIYHGDKTTAHFVELQARMDQFIQLLRAGKENEAQSHLQRIVELSNMIARKRNNEDVIAAQSISLSMGHFTDGLKALKASKTLDAIESFHLAAKQAQRAANKSGNLQHFATDLMNIMNETLNSMYTVSYNN